jgi:hypothetical protein
VAGAKRRDEMEIGKSVGGARAPPREGCAYDRRSRRGGGGISGEVSRCRGVGVSGCRGEGVAGERDMPRE